MLAGSGIRRVLLKSVIVPVVMMAAFALAFTGNAVAQCCPDLSIDDLLQSDDRAFCGNAESCLCQATPVIPATMGRLKQLFGAIFLPAELQAHALQTSMGNAIQHFHRPLAGEKDLSDSTKACLNAQLAADYPAAVRIAGPTIAYDCHGKTFDSSGSWINNDQVAQILADDHTLVAGAKMVGDIIVYRDGGGNITHTGIVTAVDGTGAVTEVCSKWGSLGEYKHAPGTSPYGGNISYYR